MAMDFGYARVSANDQNEARQVEALKNAGIPEDRIFVDRKSGKDFDREGYRKALTYLRDGDALFIQSIDRLGRDYRQIQEQWKHITQDLKADIVVLDMPLLDTRRDKDLLGTFVSDLVLQVLSFVADNERSKIKERQRQGIEIARKTRGRCGGRKPADPAKVDAAITLYMAGSTAEEVRGATGISRSVLYRELNKRGIRREG